MNYHRNYRRNPSLADIIGPDDGDDPLDDDDSKISKAIRSTGFKVTFTFKSGLESVEDADGSVRHAPTLETGIDVSGVKGEACIPIMDFFQDGLGAAIDSQIKPEILDEQVYEEVEEDDYEEDTLPQIQRSPFSQKAPPKTEGGGRRKGQAGGERNKESDRQSDQQNRWNPFGAGRSVFECSDCGCEVDDGDLSCWGCNADLE